MDEEIKEQLTELPPEERAAAWEEYVRREVNTLLDIYLPEAISGNVGVKYIRPIKSVSPKTGKKEIDETHANGVSIVITFDFADTIEFYDEDPTQKTE
jgi:hypothetical protein